VPDIPASLDIKIKRERYLAKEALQDAEHVLHKVMTDYDSEGHDTDTETNLSGNAQSAFRKQPSSDTQYNNPCHTSSNTETQSPPALRKVVIQAANSSGQNGEGGVYSRTISFPPPRTRNTVRTQQSCPEPLPASRQRTPPPIPARRRHPPPPPV